MNFLSEVALDYPDAISFASGRPAEAFFDVDAWLEAIPRFGRYLAARDGRDPVAVVRSLAQYGRTTGLINALVSAQLAHDEAITCPPERIVVTSGCQEALALCLQALCPHADDVALARNPTYIGLTGAADLAGITLVPLEEHAEGDTADAFRRTVVALRANGKRPRALYLIPEFDNPTGAVLSEREREALLAVSAEFGVVVLEDNPYGMFRFEGGRTPSLFSLDRTGLVIYLGTYSKTLCPAVRVGCAALPETFFGDASASRAFAVELSERKSFLTVNTSQLNQALVGGVLLAEGGSLGRLIEPARDFYRANRDVLLGSLAAAFADECERVSWNRPAGGFFLSVRLPFRFGRSEMLACASADGVIVMPMAFFALDGSQQERVRLSFSNLSPEEIATGVERFAGYVRRHSYRATPRRRLSLP
jgi:(S)-3,5-dihydroxyphenylglycine transaminase